MAAVTRTVAGAIIDESFAGVDPNPTGANYRYDGLGRLVAAWSTGHHYTYDFASTAPADCPTGSVANAGRNTNRVRLVDETATGTAVTGYCYDAADRILAAVGASRVTGVNYDDHGDTLGYTTGGSTTELRWDGADRNTGAVTTGADPTGSFLPAGRPLVMSHSVDVGAMNPMTAELCRHARAMWTLMQQPLAATGEIAPDRAQRRRLQKDHQPAGPVVVVTLRRRSHSTAAEQDQTEPRIEWSHRWVVRGHWRNQWHPRLGVHRAIWINEHIKGPDDKPLELKDKVITWRR